MTAPPREPINVDYALGSINAQLTTITKTLAEDRMASASYRTDIRKQLAETSEKIGHVSGFLNSAKADIEEMKPKVESLNQRAMMSKGAVNLALALSKVAHVISAGIGGIIVLLIDRYFFGKH